MNTIKEEIKITSHFVERYYERVLGETPPKMSKRKAGFKMKKINKVVDDMLSKISDRDKNNLLFMKNCKYVKLPFQNNQIVMRNGSMVTILN